jgi:hypothetical protein
LGSSQLSSSIDYPAIQKQVFDSFLRATDSDNQLSQETVKLCGPIVESRLDTLVEHRLKSEGRKRKYEELLLTT